VKTSIRVLFWILFAAIFFLAPTVFVQMKRPGIALVVTGLLLLGGVVVVLWYAGKKRE
jgi:hypothetical protein